MTNNTGTHEAPASIEPVSVNDNVLRPSVLLEWAFALGFLDETELKWHPVREDCAAMRALGVI